MKNFETENAKAICLKVIIAKKKWYILVAYQPPDTNNNNFLINLYYSEWNTWQVWQHSPSGRLKYWWV